MIFCDAYIHFAFSLCVKVSIWRNGFHKTLISFKIILVCLNIFINFAALHSNRFAVMPKIRTREIVED